jgi:CheY-like chemotaxis protein
MGKQVAIIDDDQDLLDLIDLALTEDGHHTRTFLQPESFLARAGTALPACDLLIADHNYRGMSGLALAQHLRDLGSHLPILILTGMLNGLSSKDATSISGCMLKPFDIDCLVQLVRFALGQRSEYSQDPMQLAGDRVLVDINVGSVNRQVELHYVCPKGIIFGVEQFWNQFGAVDFQFSLGDCKLSGMAWFNWYYSGVELGSRRLIGYALDEATRKRWQNCSAIRQKLGRY